MRCFEVTFAMSDREPAVRCYHESHCSWIPA
jgi:hypothetical protein